MEYRLYVTDSLFYSPQRMRLADRYADILKRMTKKEPPRSGDEIVQDIIARNGLKFKKGGTE